MRAYYRAVKRGEEWACKIERLKEKNAISYFLALCYRNLDFDCLVYKDNPLLSKIPKLDNLFGKYFPVPIFEAQPPAKSSRIRLFIKRLLDATRRRR